MKIFVLGIKGFPDICGGVDIHCERLYPLLAKQGCDVTILARKLYFDNSNRKYNYYGVHFRYLYAPRIKMFEVLVHTFIGILYSRIKSPDILHIHWLGPSFLLPFAKLLGLRVVVTHHGQDYRRLKYGYISKLIFRLGEFFAAKYSNKVIAVSDFIRKDLIKYYNCNNCFTIYNGSISKSPTLKYDYIRTLSLIPKKYVMAVGRFVKEKGFHDLIDAFIINRNDDFKLVLVGDEFKDTKYSRSLKAKALSNGVILTGFISGEKLHQVFSHAKLFVMPSYMEGLPLALLEAMGYNLPVLVSNIPSHVDLSLKQTDYYHVGDVNDLHLKLKIKLTINEVINYRDVLENKYNWSSIANNTLELYKSIID